jgi:hypothetical protein
MVFARVRERKTISEALDKMRMLVSENTLGLILDSIITGEHPWMAAYLMAGTYFSVKKRYVYMYTDTEVFHVEKGAMEMAWTVFANGINFEQLLLQYNVGLRYNVDTCWSHWFEPSKPEYDNGQKKLFFSHIEMMFETNNPEVRILFIGSGSEDTCLSGRTCETFIDYLSDAGYYGTITMYDPHEVNRSFKYKDFKVESRQEYYIYDRALRFDMDGRYFTHVYDDVWTPMITKLPEDLPIEEATMRIPLGESKFCYSYDDGKSNLVAGFKAHKEYPQGIAGGTVIASPDRLIFSGTSMTHGHYHEGVINQILDIVGDTRKRTFIPFDGGHGRKSYDPEYNICVQHPKARISVKYYGEDVPVMPGRIVGQVYYSGKERRMFFRAPEIKGSRYNGCAKGCAVCKKYNAIFNGFVVHTGDVAFKENLIRGMLARTCGRHCLSGSQSETMNLQSIVLTAAQNNTDYARLVEVVVGKGFRVSQLERAVKVLYKAGKVYTKRISNSVEYNNPVGCSDGMRYYDSTYAYYKLEGVLYLNTGEKIPICPSGLMITTGRPYEKLPELCLYEDFYIKDIMKKLGGAIGEVIPSRYSQKGKYVMGPNHGHDINYCPHAEYRHGIILYKNTRYTVYTYDKEICQDVHRLRVGSSRCNK